MTSRDYRKIVFRRLTEVRLDAVAELMNDPDVRRHMPLAQGHFGMSDCRRFSCLQKSGYGKRMDTGPGRSYSAMNSLAGAVFSPRGDDADVGLVLHRAPLGGRQSSLREDSGPRLR